MTDLVLNECGTYILHFVTACGCSRSETITSPGWKFPPEMIRVPVVDTDSPIVDRARGDTSPEDRVREFQLRGMNDIHPALPTEVWYREVLK